MLRLAYRDGMPGHRQGIHDSVDAGRALLGSFQVGHQLVYAFLLVHAAEIPSLSRAQHMARFKELASSFHGPIPTLIQEQRDPTRVVFVPVY